MNLTDLRAAIKRLEKSKTQRTRKNARLAFQRAVKDLVAAAQQEYPTMRADSSLVLRRKRRGAFCPYCKIPIRTFSKLAEHCATHHKHPNTNCLCGRKFWTYRQLGSHLARQKSIADHFAESVLKDSAGIT